MSKHAPLDAVPKHRQVFLVRWVLPGRTTQVSWYGTEHFARERVKWVTDPSRGGEAAVYTADVGTWMALEHAPDADPTGRNFRMGRAV
ncbi:hypothetical protein [Jiangella gansuensis]|uniref:hypothetical protein n=1 Tax=Jiangella gansuensis TaxID=281473 RepID=UPI00047D169B|nr:hypothetical protein [Jiangella gansuensis]